MTQHNELGYVILSDAQSKKAFGKNVNRKSPSETVLKEAIEDMERFGVEFPIKNHSSFYLPEFNLPELEGDNIAEHFDKISKDLYTEKVKELKGFANNSIPLPPKASDLILQEGWTKYPFNGKPFAVDGIEEKIAVFDCETFVKGSDFGHPILASAVSSEAYYVWMHPCFIHPTLKYFTELVEIGGRDKILIAHNAGFDRPRTLEAYSIEHTNLWFDTQSAHINVSGLASGQRWWYKMDNAARAKFRVDPPWAEHGSMNSLIDCYNFHCKPLIPLEKSEKEIRNVFVEANNFQEFRDDWRNLTEYALKDAYITFELFSILALKYLQSNPSLTTMGGHFQIMSSILPVVHDWEEWFDSCEQEWEKAIKKQDELLVSIADDLYESFKQGDITLEEIEEDPWLSQLDWTTNFKLKKNGEPLSKWYGVPKWVRDISHVDENGKVIISGLSTKNVVSHILLRLEWNDSPLIYHKTHKWGYKDENGEFQKIPHKKGEANNVGNVLSKDYETDFETGRLSSQLPQAKELIHLAINAAYWTSVRSRVREQYCHQHPEGFKMIVPATIPHNTSTNRAGENLWLTVPDPKKDKIGSEIKTRVQAPSGYVFVQSDFDAQEAVIASIFADSYYKMAGSSQLSHSILVGNKEDGTDMHSMSAKAISISRPGAKGCNYAMIYGSGVNTLANTIRMWDKSIPLATAKARAKKLLERKKGKKASRFSNKYIGGSDSNAYNEMARIADLPCPVNPLSKTKMSTAFRPAVVGKDFHTMRNNWVIQSTGSAMLHAFVTGMEFLSKKHNIPAKFCMSVHDSILYLCKEEYADQVAALFQVAHMWCWAWLRYNYDIHELPVSNAWFSSIEVDSIFRKSATYSTVTVSQPKVEPEGKSYTIKELIPTLNSLF